MKFQGGLAAPAAAAAVAFEIALPDPCLQMRMMMELFLCLDKKHSFGLRTVLGGKKVINGLMMDGQVRKSLN